MRTRRSEIVHVDVTRARARARSLLPLLLLLAGCPHHSTSDKPSPTKDDASTHAPPGADAGNGSTSDVTLPPAPPLPAVPAGLPPLPDTPAISAITPDALALGTLLFYEPRLSATGKIACATCHDPAHGYSGGIDNAADGKPDLRRTPALVNLAWASSFGWDGRYPSIDLLLHTHVSGQLGDDLSRAVSRLEDLPDYKAHFARVGGAPQDAASQALAAFVLTRYAGDAPWDRREPSARAPKPGGPPDAATAGYLLFTGKAQCAVCHTPPLYTDYGFARIGKVGVPDEGRGRVDPTLVGAFKTPTLRGAAARKALFHTGDVTSLDDAIRWYELVGADTTHHDPAKLHPALFHIALSPEEHAQLLAFLRALTSDTPAPAAPKLPQAR